MNLNFILTGAIMLSVLSPGNTRAAPSKDVQKSIKVVINAIRYNKDDLAAKYISFPEMAQRSLGDRWPALAPKDKQELVSGIETIVRKVSFPKGRDMFSHLDAMLYDAPVIKGNEATLKTTVVIHRDYKKQEIVITFVLVKSAKTWQIADTILYGESTLEGVYLDQIEPLMDEGGIQAVMQALRSKVAELKK